MSKSNMNKPEVFTPEVDLTPNTSLAPEPIVVEDVLVPGEELDNSPDVYPNEPLGIPTPPVYRPVDAVPVQPELTSLPTDVPLVEVSALREPSPHYSVGYPVIFGGEYAAIITKVWDNGLVNLIVFSAEHPVSDIKTKVPYGEGPNTWKEIN